MELAVTRTDRVMTVNTSAFTIGPLPDTPDNQQGLIVLLREFRDATGQPLFPHRTLAAIVGSTNRQASSEHCEQFRACDRELFSFLQRRRKVDGAVVEAAQSILEKEPLISTTALAEQVGAKLQRSDLTVANMDAALDQIPCRVARQAMRGQIETGAAHWSEQPLLEAAMSALTETPSAPDQASLLDKLRANGLEVPSEAAPNPDVAATPPESVVRGLLTPDQPLSAIPIIWQIVVFCLTLFYRGVPLSVLGAWLAVHKTTVLRRMTGLAIALWTPIQDHIRRAVTAHTIYVDEKWLKIRGRWHYWFVVLDAATELPVLAFLTARRNHWACRWLFVSLKRMGKNVAVVVTDGMAAYGEAFTAVFAGGKHVLCLFHYKQAVTVWLKKNVSDPNKLAAAKKRMKALVDTVDPRTFQRRLTALIADAANLGIENWIPLIKQKMDALLPAIRRNNIPTTTNAIERFFRAFNRFYKTKNGFFTVESAGRELIIFMLMYVMIIQPTSGQAPIEAIWPDANRTPLYRLINNPLLLFSQPETAKYLQNCQALAALPEQKAAQMP